MIHINYIMNNKEGIIGALEKRNIDVRCKIENIYDNEILRKQILLITEKERAEFNILNKNRENIELCINLKKDIKENEVKLKNIEKEIFDILITIPNIPHEDVKFGKGYDDNEIIFQNKIEEHKNKLTHWDIAEKKGIINFELGTKLAERGFPVYIGKGAKLQRALINFCLDEATEYGFTEHQVPILVNKDAVYATGQFPDKEDMMYHIEKDDLYLIPTAEVPLTNMFRDKTFEETELPIMVAGYTPCFRREAGNYGKEIKGLNRLHQFDKVELVCITTQEDGYKRLEMMREYIQGLLDKLGLTYRILKLCGFELGFGAAKAYDIEAYCPVQNKWVEVVTVTNFDTFQANRMNCKYRANGGKKLVHTLNGTGLALPRIVAAIFETFQKDENIVIPEVLRRYTGFDMV